MITLCILFFLFCVVLVVLSIAFGILAVSPILLIIFGLALLDYIVYKIVKKIMSS